MQEKKNRRWRKAAAVCACMLAFILSMAGSRITAKADAIQTQIHYTKDGISYTFTGTGDEANPYYANIEGYDATSSVVKGSLDIPASIKYYPDYPDGNIVDQEKTHYDVEVRGILNNAFAGCTTLRYVTLPYTVNYIGQSAFENCTALERVTTRPEGAASGKDQDPSGDIVWAETIEYRAFAGCTALAGLTLQYESAGRSISVASEAFFGCTGLKTFTIGAGVTDLGAGVLANCTALDGGQNSIKVMNNNKYFVKEGILYQRVNNTNNILVQCPTGKIMSNETALADYVTQIKDEAFYGCKNLYSIDIPATVTSIGYRSFYGCTSLGNVTIPDSVTEIGAQAFEGCGSVLCFTCTSGSAADNYAKNNGISRNVACTVTFYNTYTRDTVVRTTMNGGTVELPQGWERDGYVLRWSDDFDGGTVVQESKTVYTVWHRMFTVTFKDAYSGQESVMAGVEEGASVDPPKWTRNGYRLSWSTEAYKNVNADLTVNAIWLVSLTDPEVGEDAYRTGTIVTVDNVRYKVTDSANKYVYAVGMSNTSLTTLTIPDTVIFGGSRYKVRAITANAFRSNRNIRFVSVGKNVKIIGRAAFYGCSSIRKFTIYSRGLTTFGTSSFKGTRSNLAVYTMTNVHAKKYRPKLLNAGMSLKATVKKLS